MKKLLSTALAVALLASLATGCGNTAGTGNEGNASAGNEPESTAAEGQPDAPADGEKITLKYLSWQAEATKKLEEDAIKTYMEENPNIIIEPQFVTYSDYTSKLNTLLAGKSEPDVYLLQEYYTLQYGNEGLVENLMPYFEADGVDPAEKFVPGTAAMKGSECYGVGKDSAVIMLFYNKGLFEKYGITTPPTKADDVWNWDEYVETAKKLTIDANGNNAASPDFAADSITTYGTFVANPWLLWLPFLYSAGGSIGTEDGMASALASPETIDAVTKLTDLINVHKVAPTPAVVGSMPTTAAMMKADQLAMYPDGAFAIPALNEAEVDYGVALLPKIKEAKTITWTAHYVVSARQAHKQESYDFLSWFVDPVTNPLVLQHGLPSNKEFLNNEKAKLNEIYGEENANTIVGAINDTATVPENITLKNFGKIADQHFTPAMDKVTYGEASAETVLKELDGTCASFFEGRWDK